ncbi:MAG: hypothetical protein OXH09_19185 [Gammaproteobacteria bacterium]|nr:hypothetical protein [Gammaproteobacteria bacterium]
MRPEYDFAGAVRGITARRYALAEIGAYDHTLPVTQEELVVERESDAPWRLAEQLLTDRFTRVKRRTKYIAGFVTASGHQIAQERRGELIRTWVEVKPPQFVGVTVEYYPPSRVRNSNLVANAPRLAKGKEAWKVAVEEIATFTDVVDWYGGL